MNSDDKILEAVKRDIARFHATGRLPQSHDVTYNGYGGTRDYWDWVDRITGGQEPQWNSGDSQLATDEKAAITDNAERFKEWIAEELPKLDETQQELFRLAYVKGHTQTGLASYFGVDQATISRWLDRMKADLRFYLLM